MIIATPLPPLDETENYLLQCLLPALDTPYTEAIPTLPPLSAALATHVMAALAELSPRHAVRQKWLPAIATQHHLLPPDGSLIEPVDPDDPIPTLTAFAFETALLPLHHLRVDQLALDIRFAGITNHMITQTRLGSGGNVLESYTSAISLVEREDATFPRHMAIALLDTGVRLNSEIALSCALRLLDPAERLRQLHRYRDEKAVRRVFVHIENSDLVRKESYFQPITGAEQEAFFTDIPRNERQQVFSCLLKLKHLPAEAILPFAPTPAGRRAVMDKIIGP